MWLIHNILNPKSENLYMLFDLGFLGLLNPMILETKATFYVAFVVIVKY